MTIVSEHNAHNTIETSPAAVAQLSSVTMKFGNTPVLDKLDLSVNAGEIVALIGQSGSGKSTTLRLLAGLSTPSAGTVHTDGAPAVAFQEPRLFPWRSVAANVGYGLNRVGVDSATKVARVSEALAEVGLTDKANAWPLTLSGGQAQRVSLARALIAEPRLLLLDEPFGALDALTRSSMHTLLMNIWQRHRFGVLLVTHDVNEAVALADRVVVLDGGHISHDTPIDAPRPRDRTNSYFADTVDTLLRALGTA